MGCRCAMVLALVLWGCSHRVLMDEPSIDRVDPSLVCLDSLPAVITIHGDGMHPVVHNLLGEPEVILPGISLVRIRTETGDPVSPHEIFDIPADMGDEEPAFRWISDALLQIDLPPSHGLRPGIYSITIENPDGKIHTLTEALLLFRTPDIESVEADVSEPPSRTLSVVLTGGPFFNAPASWPLFFFEGAPLSYPPDWMRGCRSFHVQSTMYETCTEVEYVLPGTLLIDEDLSDRAFYVAPFGESDCAARHDEGIDLAPCPTITSVDPRIACPREGGRTVTITGTSLVFDVEAEPQIQVGADLFDPVLGGCTGSAGERTCSTMTFEYPGTEIDEVITLDLHLTNLLMEGHCIEPEAQLSLAPPPQIHELSHRIEHDASPATIWVNGEYLMWEGALPLISFAGEEPEPVDDIYYCDYLTDMVGETSLCLTILASVPPHLVVPGTVVPFTVTHAPPIGCTSTMTGNVLVSEEP